MDVEFGLRSSAPGCADEPLGTDQVAVATSADFTLIQRNQPHIEDLEDIAASLRRDDFSKLELPGKFTTEVRLQPNPVSVSVRPIGLAHGGAWGRPQCVVDSTDRVGVVSGSKGSMDVVGGQIALRSLSGEVWPQSSVPEPSRSRVEIPDEAVPPAGMPHSEGAASTPES